MAQPMRRGRSCMAGSTFIAARMRGTKQRRVGRRYADGCVLPPRMSLRKRRIKQICAMAKLPICPSKLPITPIASPMAQKRNPNVIWQGSNPMLPAAKRIAGKASRMANNKCSSRGPPKGKKNHNAANRKATMVVLSCILCLLI